MIPSDTVKYFCENITFYGLNITLTIHTLILLIAIIKILG